MLFSRLATVYVAFHLCFFLASQVPHTCTHNLAVLDKYKTVKTQRYFLFIVNGVMSQPQILASSTTKTWQSMEKLIIYV